MEKLSDRNIDGCRRLVAALLVSAWNDLKDPDLRDEARVFLQSDVVLSMSEDLGLSRDALLCALADRF